MAVKLGSLSLVKSDIKLIEDDENDVTLMNSREDEYGPSSWEYTSWIINN